MEEQHQLQKHPVREIPGEILYVSLSIYYLSCSSGQQKISVKQGKSYLIWKQDGTPGWELLAFRLCFTYLI